MKKEASYIRHPHYPEIIKFKIGSVKTISTLSTSNVDETDLNTLERLSLNGDCFQFIHENSSNCGGDLDKFPNFPQSSSSSNIQGFHIGSKSSNIQQHNLATQQLDQLDQMYYEMEDQYYSTNNTSQSCINFQNQAQFSDFRQGTDWGTMRMNDQSIYQCQNEYDLQQMTSSYHQNFQEQLREKIDVPSQQQQYVASTQLLQSTLRKLDRLGFSKGTFTCSTKSAYSFKEDILSEEQDGDDEDSIHQTDVIMDEQDEIDEIQSDTGSGVYQHNDNRSLVGDLEMEPVSSFCFFCRKAHYQSSQDGQICPEMNSFNSGPTTNTTQSQPSQNQYQNQTAYMKKVAKLNYHNLKLIQESQEEYFDRFKHTTTYTTTTTTKSSCCGSETYQRSSQKKTVRTLILEDQMSQCSCGRKSIKGSEYGGSVSGGQSVYLGRDKVKSSNLSDISSLNEYQEMSHSLAGLNQSNQFQQNQQFHIPYGKKGPSSINSVKTCIAKYSGNILTNDFNVSQSPTKNVRFNTQDDEFYQYKKQKANYEAQMNQTTQRKWFLDDNGYQQQIVTQYIKKPNFNDLNLQQNQFQEKYPSQVRGIRNHSKKLRCINSTINQGSPVIRRSSRNLQLKFGNNYKLSDAIEARQQENNFRLNLRKIALNLDEIEDNYQGEESGGDSQSSERTEGYNSHFKDSTPIVKLVPRQKKNQKDKKLKLQLPKEIDQDITSTQQEKPLDQMSINPTQRIYNFRRGPSKNQDNSHHISPCISVRINAKIDSSTSVLWNNNSPEQQTIPVNTHCLNTNQNASQTQHSSNNSSQNYNYGSINLQSNQNHSSDNSLDNYTIGPLSCKDRIIKVRAYWQKKKQKLIEKLAPKKYQKKKRQADKKMRINGRFVSLKQAKSALQMTKKEFKNAIKKQEMKNPESKKIKKKKKIDAKVIWPKKNKAIKLSNAQELLKIKKRKNDSN
eukprot:403336772